MKNDLIECKYCNKPAEGFWGSDGYGFGVYYIGCSDMCDESEDVSGCNVIEAIEEWNELNKPTNH